MCGGLLIAAREWRYRTLCFGGIFLGVLIQRLSLRFLDDGDQRSLHNALYACSGAGDFNPALEFALCEDAQHINNAIFGDDLEGVGQFGVVAQQSAFNL